MYLITDSKATTNEITNTCQIWFTPMQLSSEQIITLNATHFDRTQDTNSYELGNTYFPYVYDFQMQSHLHRERKNIHDNESLQYKF